MIRNQQGSSRLARVLQSEELVNAVTHGIGLVLSIVKATPECDRLNRKQYTNMTDGIKQKVDDADDPIRFLEIEFIGGPYDGHTRPCFTRRAQLPADLVWFVCEDAIRLLDGNDQRPGGSITSVALYELELRNGASRYRFARAISVEEITTSIRGS